MEFCKYGIGKPYGGARHSLAADLLSEPKCAPYKISIAIQHKTNPAVTVYYFLLCLHGAFYRE